MSNQLKQQLNQMVNDGKISFKKVRENNDRKIFSEKNIEKLFGCDAAEQEDPERLKECYFKSTVYEQISSPVSLRILVGHKGIGKSALFKIAASEGSEQGILPIWIRPDDIISIRNKHSDIIEMIALWKVELRKIIYNKLLYEIYEENSESIPEKILHGKFKSFMDYCAEMIFNRTDKLTDVKKAISNTFCENKKVCIYFDDLDRGWKGSEKDIEIISALLNAVRDISSEDRNIFFRISLRSDVYYFVRTSDESTDKISGNVIWLSWTNTEILSLFAKRIETFFGGTIEESRLLKMYQSEIAKYILPVVTEHFEGIGKWKDQKIYKILISLIRKRPRDLTKLCTLAARKAYIRNSSKIETQDFLDIFDEYSRERLQDTENEFKSELPDIRRLMLTLKPSVKKSAKRFTDVYVMDTDTILKKIKISSEPSDRKAYYFTRRPNLPASPDELLAFLYKINFLTARHKNAEGKIIRKYFEENKYLTETSVNFGFSWEVHPAFRWALEPDDFNIIYNQLDILDFD